LIALYPGAANFDPEAKRVLDVALEMTRISLRLEDDFANGMIANQIIEIAKTGERNPDLLYEGALKKLPGTLSIPRAGAGCPRLLAPRRNVIHAAGQRAGPPAQPFVCVLSWQPRPGSAHHRLALPPPRRPHRASDSKGGANDGRQAADQGDARADHGGGPRGIDMRLDNRVKMPALILKRASASRPSGEWSDDDYDVLADGVVVGRIMKASAVPVGMSWMWMLAFGHYEDRTPTHGYAATREDAMAAFAKSWRRE
jgi:hypothetical protein